MLPFTRVLTSIDIGVDRVGSRLPLQGRCACLRLDLDPFSFTWWQRWDCVVLHQDLAVLRSCSLFFYYPCFLVLLLSSSLLCRLAFGPPSEPTRRSEKEAAADETPDHHNVEGADSVVRGWEGHPSYPLSPGRM